MLTRKPAFLLLMSLLGTQVLPLPARAAEPPACETATTTAQMLQCAGARFDEADRELNRIYGEVMAHLDEARRAQLRTAQRAWITFRDAQALFEGGAAQGGSLKGVLELSAKAALTRERTEQLKKSPP